MTIDETYILEHFGVRGMHWGVRKEKPVSDQPTKSHKVRNASVILGSVAVAAAITAGGVYAHKRMGMKTSDIPKVSETAAKFSKAIAKEPVGIVHVGRGKNKGFHFLQHGGLTEPLHEHEKAGFVGNENDHHYFARYGDRKEKAAVRFLDPEGRKDAAGRNLPHEVMIPESLAKGITSHSDAVKLVWPLIKDVYGAMYEASKKGP